MSKNTNQKPSHFSNTLDLGPTPNDSLLNPKTPIKRHPQDQSSIFSKLSPLPLAPKIEQRAIEAPFNSHHEMLYVETPVPK